MRIRSRLALTGVALAGVAAMAMAAATQGARSQLTLPDPAPDEDAAGNLSVKHFDARGNRPERSWIRTRVRHLERKTEYSLWMDDPSTVGDETMVQFATFTTNGGGNANDRIDTKRGGTIPFSSSIDGLAGLAFEVRDPEGVVMLVGTFPDITPE